MPKFLNEIRENGKNVPTSSNDTVADIVYVTQEEFDELEKLGQLTNNTLYMIDENGTVIDKIKGDLTPIGAIIPYAGEVAPESWLICDGSAISRIKYSDLFSVIRNSIWCR